MLSCFQGIGANCGPSLVDQGVSEADKVEIVRLHNELRARIANGLARGSAAPLPPAANMMQLTWDNEVLKCYFFKAFMS
jgi:hypothetical protein